MVSAKKQLKLSNEVRIGPRESGVGFPYAPENWPNPGDNWGWTTGSRSTSTGYYKDRYLIAPLRLQKRPRKKISLRSKKSITEFITTEFPGADVDGFWASFRWEIPAKKTSVKAKVGSAVEVDVGDGDGPMEQEVSEEESEEVKDEEEEEASDIKDETEEESSEEDVGRENPLEVAVRRIREMKRQEAEKRRTIVAADVGISGRTRRKTAIGVQFHNTKANPVVIDDEEGPKMRSFVYEGVTINAPTFYKNGNHVVSRKYLIKALEEAIPAVSPGERATLEEARRKLILKSEKKVSGGSEVSIKSI